jgi:hypothetical protein
MECVKIVARKFEAQVDFPHPNYCCQDQDYCCQDQAMLLTIKGDTMRYSIPIRTTELRAKNGRFLNLGKCLAWGAFWGVFTSFSLWGMVAGMVVGVLVSAITASAEKRVVN